MSHQFYWLRSLCVASVVIALALFTGCGEGYDSQDLSSGQSNPQNDSLDKDIENPFDSMSGGDKSAALGSGSGSYEEKPAGECENGKRLVDVGNVRNYSTLIRYYMAGVVDSFKLRDLSITPQLKETLEKVDEIQKEVRKNYDDNFVLSLLASRLQNTLPDFARYYSANYISVRTPNGRLSDEELGALSKHILTAEKFLHMMILYTQYAAYYGNCARYPQ